MSRSWWGRGVATMGTALSVAGGLAAPAQAGPVLVFSVPSVDFDSVVRYTFTERTVTVTNTGDKAFTPWRFDISPWAGQVEYDPASSTCRRNEPIPAQSSCTLELYTMADDLGSLAGLLSVVDTDALVVASVPITGQVVAPPPSPDGPKKAKRVVLPGNRSEISWSQVREATSYEVQSNWRTICRVQAPDTSCISGKAWGQWVNVHVLAKNGPSVSDGVEAKYTVANVPVSFTTLKFSTKSATLNNAQRAEAVAAANALIRQGWHTNITVTAGKKPGTAVAAARAQAVRGLLFKRWRFYHPRLDRFSVDTRLRGGGNTVRIQVQ